MAQAVRRDASGHRSGAARGGFLGIDDVALMAGELTDADRGDDRMGLIQLSSAWRRAVGTTLARASRPGAFRGATLTVEVRDAAWKRELERLEPLIRVRLTRLLPTRPIGGIAFQIDRTLRPVPMKGRRQASIRDRRSLQHDAPEPDLFRAPAQDLLGRFTEVMGRYLRDQS